MTNAEFRELCRATCLALNLPDTEALHEEGQIEIDDVTIGAFFDEESDTAVHCYVDLGPVAAPHRPEAFERMLELNLELGRRHGETVGFDRDSGRMVLRAEMTNPDQLDGAQLAECFEGYAAFARELGMQIDEDNGHDHGGDMHDRLA